MADLNILCHASQVDRLEGIQPSTLAHYTNYVELVNDGVSARDDQHSFNGTPVSKSQYYSKFHAKRPGGSIDCQAKENTAPVSTVLLIQHVGIDHRKKTIDSPTLRAYVRGTVILV